MQNLGTQCHTFIDRYIWKSLLGPNRSSLAVDTDGTETQSSNTTPSQLKRHLVCGKVDYSLVYSRPLLGIQGTLALVYQSLQIFIYHLQKMEQGLHKT